MLCLSEIGNSFLRERSTSFPFCGSVQVLNLFLNCDTLYASYGIFVVHSMLGGIKCRQNLKSLYF